MEGTSEPNASDPPHANLSSHPVIESLLSETPSAKKSQMDKAAAAAAAVAASAGNDGDGGSAKKMSDERKDGGGGKCPLSESSFSAQSGTSTFQSNLNTRTPDNPPPKNVSGPPAAKYRKSLRSTGKFPSDENKENVPPSSTNPSVRKKLRLDFS